MKIRPAIFLLSFCAALCFWAGSAGASPKSDLRAGFAAIRLGDAHSALKSLDKALNSKGLSRNERVLGHTLKGDCYRYLKDFKQAVAEYNKAIKLANKRVPKTQMALLYSNRGKVYHRQGKYDKAVRDYTIALKYNSKAPRIYYRRGTSWRLKRNYKKAVADYSQAIRLNPSPSYYYSRSQAYVRMKRLDLAVRDMETAVRMRPESRQFRTRLEYLKSLRDR